MSKPAVRYDAMQLFRFFPSEMTDETIAEVLGISRHTVRKWKYGNGTSLSTFEADRYAIRAGVHPSAVWGQSWWVGAGE